MNTKQKNDDYGWVIVESVGQEDNFVGLNDTQSGETFIPVTAEREQGLVLLGRLPAGPQGSTRRVEAIHQAWLMETAGPKGFAIYLVDQNGRMLKRLDAVKAN
ncbi:conserved hypothetical protein [Desulfarculales bacterium]